MRRISIIIIKVRTTFRGKEDSPAFMLSLPLPFSLRIIIIFIIIISWPCLLAMASDCNKSFANSYMLLKPEEAHFFDIFHVLFSRNLGHRKFVDSDAEGTFEGSFRKRWLIFVSIVLQKVMLHVAKPLAFFGSCVEMLINLVALNGGILRILFNFLTGEFNFFLLHI